MNRRPATPSPATGTRILVFDDEKDMLTNYRRLLSRAGHECLALDNPDRLEEQLVQFAPDLVLTDLLMPGTSGMDVLERVHDYDPALPVIIITAHGSIESAVEAIKRHAADYLTKPFSGDELLQKIQVLLSQRVIARSPAVQGRAAAAPWRRAIIGISSQLDHVLELAQKVARTDVNVLIVGESGTGKEVIARLIHQLSVRQSEAFVPVDCASLPENLLESELFGYRKGAFTGATADKMGLFEFADHGTLFLDEIGEMPFALQAKLLRVLQEKKFRAIGGRHQTSIDVRVLAATNRDLEESLREKTFRNDLYYRLNVVTLRLPPLRDRREDIPLLADHFLSQFARDNRLLVDRIELEAMDCLKRFDWPGNVRELQNVVEYAATLSNGPRIAVQDLPVSVQGVGAKPATEATGEDRRGREQALGHFERDYLIGLLVEHRFNISQAAQSAGCHRRTLYRMIHRHKIDLDQLRLAHLEAAPPLLD